MSAHRPTPSSTLAAASPRPGVSAAVSSVWPMLLLLLALGVAGRADAVVRPSPVPGEALVEPVLVVPGAAAERALSVAPEAASAARRDGVRLAQGEAPRFSLDAAVAKVRGRYKGQVVRAETRYTRDGQPVHHVRVLTSEGRLRTVRVDGRTGRFL